MKMTFYNENNTFPSNPKQPTRPMITGLFHWNQQKRLNKHANIWHDLL